MDAVGFTLDHSIHIHNYSFGAVRSYISEVQKYPVIYTGSIQVPYPKGLIDFSWAKIVSALLDEAVNFDLQRREYWNQSFRQLWKWMQLVLVQDMLARQNKGIHYRSAEHSWLVHLQFLEPFIEMNGNSVIGIDTNAEFESDIQIKIDSSQTVIDIKTNDHTVVWLRDASEPEDSQNMYISVLLRVPAGFTTNLNQQPTGIGVFSPIHKGDSNRQITNFAANPVGVFDQNVPCQSTSTQDQQVIILPGAFKLVTADDALCQRDPCLSPNNQQNLTICSLTEAFEENEGNQIKDVPLPEVSAESVVDEDHQFIMSFLPKLKELDKKKRAEVKVLMIRAVQKAYNASFPENAKK